MDSSAEEQTRDADIEAFFALPRSALLLGALTVLVALAGITVGLTVFGDRLGPWVIPMIAGSTTVVVAMLRRSAVGRGVLWSFSRPRYRPTIVVGIWATLTVLTAIIAAWLTFAAA